MAREIDREVDEPSSPTCYLAGADPAYSGLVLPSPKARGGERRDVSSESAQIAAPAENSECSPDEQSPATTPDADGAAAELVFLQGPTN